MYEKYLIVNSINDAVEYGNQYLGNSKYVSGGTDLVLEMERGLHDQVNVIIDISRIQGLDQIVFDEEKVIHIGPTVTHNACIRSEVIRQYAYCLFQACRMVGSPQVRNRGTIVGNLATASPANDTISALLTLDAKVKLQSIEGIRIVELSKLFTGVRRTILKPGELIVDVFFKALEENEYCNFQKNALRNAQAISIINTSVVLTLRENKIVAAKIALGSVAPTVFRAWEAEEYLIGKEPIKEVFNQASRIAEKLGNPISDIRASDEYRKNMIRVHVRRCLEEAIQTKSLLKDIPISLWGKENEPNKPLLENSIELSNKSKIEVNVNGKNYLIENAFNKTLLHMLRENILLTGTKEGCGEGECGACTVFMDGIAVLACLIPAPRAHHCKIETIESVSENGELHPIQQSFIEEGAVQCGYCTPGFVMSSIKMLEENAHPTVEQIKEGISGNLCRCTGYYKIIKAIESAVKD